MTLSFTMKQHDTRPIRTFVLSAPDPATPTSLIVQDLTLAASAKLIAKDQAGIVTWTSALAFGTLVSGQVIYTPVAGDTAVADTFQLEIEVTWSDGGIETYPNDSYFAMVVFPDLG